MGKYKIAGIKLEFNYQFDDFFKGRIEKYETNELCNITMNTNVVDYIPVPDLEIKLKFKNRVIYIDGDKEIVCVYDKDNKKINIKVVYTKDYSKVDIYFNKSLGDNLAEYEYIVTGIYFLEIALRHQLIPIHASAISYNNEAIIFSAPSTTGKSTHARLWQQVFEDVIIINDDKPLIKYENNQFLIVGTPWSGKSILNENLSVPLKAIVFLKQNKDNFVEELKINEKLTYFLRNIYRPMTEELFQDLLDTLEVLINKIPIYLLNCNISEEAVYTIYNKLYKREGNKL